MLSEIFASVASAEPGAVNVKMSPAAKVDGLDTENDPVALAVNVTVPKLLPFFARSNTAVPVLADVALLYEPPAPAGIVNARTATNRKRISEAFCPPGK